MAFRPNASISALPPLNRNISDESANFLANAAVRNGPMTASLPKYPSTATAPPAMAHCSSPDALDPPKRTMRILVHDFSGHPFQIDLSKRLANRGHQVVHVHCPSYATGKGDLQGNDRLTVVGIRMRGRFSKYTALRRLTQEFAYGFRFLRVVRSADPDIVVSCNDPLFSKAVAALYLRLRHVPWLFWLQDLYSVAIAHEFQQRDFFAAGALGALIQRVERSLLRWSTAIVAITPDFLPVLSTWQVPSTKCTVIENWAPLDELPPRPRLNDWRKEHGFGSDPIFLYSGTLGLKHNPDHLYQLARTLNPLGARVVVVSEGLGSDYLEQRLRDDPLSNLHVLPFQPYDRLPDILGAADVLLVLLESHAGAFSVPSKLLTSLCAGRPILAAVPAENLAARTIRRAQAGLCANPNDVEAFLNYGIQLLDSEQLREHLGRNARAYAERRFDGATIADAFEAIFLRVVPSHPSNTREYVAQ